MQNVNYEVAITKAGRIGTLMTPRDPREELRFLSLNESRMAKWSSSKWTLSVLRRVGGLATAADMEWARGESAKDWTACRCLIHRLADADLDARAGCGSCGEGTHVAIRAVYDGVARPCLVEAGVRRLDKECFDMIELGIIPMRARRKQRYEKGYGATVADMGRGYCYLIVFPDGFTMRLARLLGPAPAIRRLLRYMVYFGSETLVGIEIELVGETMVHLRKNGSAVQPLAGLVSQLLGLLGRGYERVGADEEVLGCGSVGQVRQFLLARGVPLLGYAAERDMVIVTRTAGTMPVDFPEGRARLKQLAMVGDRVAKLIVAVDALRCDVSVDLVSRHEQAHQTDRSFGERAVACGFMKLVVLPHNVDPASARVGGTAFEALLGLVYTYCGYEASVAFMNSVGCERLAE